MPIMSGIFRTLEYSKDNFSKTLLCRPFQMFGKTLNISMSLEMLPDFRFCFSYIEAYLSIIRKYIHTYSLEVLKLSSSP